MAQTNTSSGRALALARRKAMSNSGKSAVARNGDVTRAEQRGKPKAATPAPVSSPAPSETTSDRAASPARARRRPAAAVATSPSHASRDASLARRRAMSTRGKSTQNGSDRTRSVEMIRSAKAQAAVPAKEATPSEPCCSDCAEKQAADAASQSVARSASSGRQRSSRSKKRRSEIALSSSKLTALARRKAQSTRGKAGINSNGMSQAQTARAANPNLSGRELAQTLREQRSKRGSSGQKSSRPTGRVRKASDNAVGGAKDATWKVGASDTARGQTVTGTMVGRDKAVTGDEASTCRDITGTEYMGADIFRDFCQAEPVASPVRGGVSETQSGNTVTGNEVGRSKSVTGDEPGTCASVTGTEYVGAAEAEGFCGTKSEKKPMPQVMGMTDKEKVITGDNVVTSNKVTGGEAGATRQLTGAQYVQPINREAPAKVGRSTTLSGGEVTGTEVGRSAKTTGDEAGSCRAVTGDDYLGQEQFQNFCKSTPAAQDQKVGVSTTDGGKAVTGTLNGRSERVTGNEPGTCKAVTGTPYAGAEQASAYCDAESSRRIAARTSVMPSKGAADMTGIQPAVGGTMTGDSKGACESISGTPYVGRTQQAEACSAVAADPASSDFPQTLEGAEWGEFSVESPSHASVDAEQHSAVTGAPSGSRHITGPFGMAGGKVTGTEDARFGNMQPVVAEEPTEIDGRVKSRISGEGMNAGAKITGDDWDRGDRVTGTEGSSAVVRNQTRRGVEMGSMAQMQRNREVENTAPQPVSKVTGASGNTENGSLITYSGGARG